MWRIRYPVILLVAALAPLSVGAGQGNAELEDGQLIRFEVFDAEDGERLYSGVERIAVRDGTVRKETVYRAPDQAEIMLEDVSYELDSLRVNSFVSEHPRVGERVALRRDGKRLYIEYRPRAGEAVKRSDRLTWGPQTRVGKTLHHIIVRNWERLIAGERVGFDLLVPSKFESYRFQLREHARAQTGERVFRLEPESWLVRQFVSPMDFHYDDSRRAVKYVGPTTVGFYDQPDRLVEIRFSY